MVGSSSTLAILLEELSLQLKPYSSLLWELRKEVDFSLLKGSELLQLGLGWVLAWFWGMNISLQITILLVLFWVVVFLILRLGIWLSRRDCKCKGSDLSGKTVLITGAETGIGYEMTQELALRGARVIMACKNLKLGMKACINILEVVGDGHISVRKLDLSSLENVRFFAECIVEGEERLDVLVLQEKTFLTKKYLTEDNLELHMASNYFGHFLLTHLLYPLLLKTGNARIAIGIHPSYKSGRVQLNNLNSEFSFDDSSTFCTSQLSLYYMAKELTQRFPSSPITVNCFESNRQRVEPNERIPSCNGDISQVFRRYFDTSPREASQIGIHICVANNIGKGKMYSNCRSESDLYDDDNKGLSGELWSKTIEILQEPT